jgi:hypothetical protein
MPIPDSIEPLLLKRVLVGLRLQAFRDGVIRLWRHALRRRGQNRPYNWEHLQVLVRRWLPSVRILHPYPSVRFAATHPRDRSRMREIRLYGSVRGVAGDRYPYRDPPENG